MPPQEIPQNNNAPTVPSPAPAPASPASSPRSHKVALIVSLCAFGLIVIVVIVAWWFVVQSNARLQNSEKISSQNKSSVELGEKYVSTDQSLPFTIQPPKGWVLTTNVQQGTAVAFDAPGSQAAYVSVDHSQMQAGQTASLLQRADAEKDYIEQNNRDVTMLGYSALTIGDTPARQIEWTDTYQGMRTHTLELVIAKGQITYFVLYSSSEAEWSKYKDAGMASTRSFRATS